MLPKSRLLSILLVLSFASPSLIADVPSADAALQQGRVGETSTLLHAWLLQHPSDASAHLLLCRAFYAQDLINAAVSECEAAAANAPRSSVTQLWLGRAYGMKASSANPLVAFSIARKVRDAFEHAVQLDPANLPAMSDLGEFYVAAPSIVGGGTGKARILAVKLHAMNGPAAEAQSHRILAFLADKAKDNALAETEFRAATAGNSPEAWIDLGAFYAHHQQPDKAAAAVQSGIAADTARGATLVDAASVLTEAGRDPELARRLLREYLDSPAKTDAAPAFKVHLQLGDLLARSGDLSSAHKEYAAALALAPDFSPAQKVTAFEHEKSEPHPAP